MSGTAALIVLRDALGTELFPISSSTGTPPLNTRRMAQVPEPLDDPPPDELEELAEATVANLNGEIGLTRVAARRVLGLLDEAESDFERVALLNAITMAAMPRCHECSAVFSRREASASQFRRSTPFKRSTSMKKRRASAMGLPSG